MGTRVAKVKKKRRGRRSGLRSTGRETSTLRSTLLTPRTNKSRPRGEGEMEAAGWAATWPTVLTRDAAAAATAASVGPPCREEDTSGPAVTTLSRRWAEEVTTGRGELAMHAAPPNDKSNGCRRASHRPPLSPLPPPNPINSCSPAPPAAPHVPVATTTPPPSRRPPLPPLPRHLRRLTPPPAWRTGGWQTGHDGRAAAVRRAERRRGRRQNSAPASATPRPRQRPGQPPGRTATG